MTSQLQTEVINRNELTNAAGVSFERNNERRTQNIVNQGQDLDESGAIINFDINFGMVMRVNSNQSENDNLGILDEYEDVTSTYPDSIMNRDYDYTTTPLFFSSVNNNYFVVN
jgi:hypothetical protein